MTNKYLEMKTLFKEVANLPLDTKYEQISCVYGAHAIKFSML